VVDRDQITGLILAGGQGSRLGGIDKGLQNHLGEPLARHALQRLSPQVAHVMISANRNLDAYRLMGAPVWADAPSAVAHEGPLAGFIAGLEHCETPYLVTVPCDCPRFPIDLVQRLSQALEASGTDIAVAATQFGDETRFQPTFCLMKKTVQGSLQRFMQSGERKIGRWVNAQPCVRVVFADTAAFFNVNTPDDLAQLRAQGNAAP